MSTVTAKPVRREVQYESLAEVLADAERLAGGKFRTAGRWSFGQILEHLARTMNCEIDGFGFKAPWVARTFIAPFVKNSFFTRPLPAGFQLPKTASKLLPPEVVSVETGLEHFRQAMRRLESESQRAKHPFFGQLASQEWNSLDLRHSELHMSFVHADETP